MYAYIAGEVTELLIDRAVLEAGGVGYELVCSQKTLQTLQLGKHAKLCTHLHLAEDVMALYGFADDTERSMFRRLLSVTRVGPKLALGVLSTLTPGDVAAAIVTENAAALSAVPGMGKKTAQRVLLELKEKVGAQEMVAAGVTPVTPSDARNEAVAALMALGYDGATASRAVANVQEDTGVEGILQAALRTLAKN